MIMNDQDCVDGEVVFPPELKARRAPSIEALHSEMPCRRPHKEFGRRALRTLLNRLRLRRAASADISQPDPSYKVAYLGNVLTGWAKGEGCVEKPLATLWRNYTQSSRPDVRMQLTVSGGGLKANTKDHGLTEYWANRITFCAAPKHFPRIFCWVYRHEGRRLRHELRCHAVLCSSNSVARQIETQLRNSLAQALAEFKKDKVSRQNARLSLVNSVYENPSMPRRKILLSTGSTNYRPPLERSKSAPKLTTVEENLGEEDEEYSEDYRKIASFTVNGTVKILRHCDSTSALMDKRLALRQRLAEASGLRIPTRIEDDEDVIQEKDDDDRRVSFDPNSHCLNEEDEPKDNTRILEEIIAESSSNSNENNLELTWFRRTDIPADLIPLDSDEGSLSSGCESASTFNSTEEHTPNEQQQQQQQQQNEPDFKLGGTVLSSLDRLTNCADVRKYCGLKHHMRVSQEVPDAEEVSLIPVGEAQTDFSSLKVFKKKTVNEIERDSCLFDATDGGSDNSEGDEADSACSDESGYSELIENNDDSPSPISKIVLV